MERFLVFSPSRQAASRRCALGKKKPSQSDAPAARGFSLTPAPPSRKEKQTLPPFVATMRVQLLLLLLRSAALAAALFAKESGSPPLESLPSRQPSPRFATHSSSPLFSSSLPSSLSSSHSPSPLSAVSSSPFSPSSYSPSSYSLCSLSSSLCSLRPVSTLTCLGEKASCQLPHDAPRRRHQPSGISSRPPLKAILNTRSSCVSSSHSSSSFSIPPFSFSLFSDCLAVSSSSRALFSLASIPLPLVHLSLPRVSLQLPFSSLLIQIRKRCVSLSPRGDRCGQRSACTSPFLRDNKRGGEPPWRDRVPPKTLRTSPCREEDSSRDEGGSAEEREGQDEEARQKEEGKREEGEGANLRAGQEGGRKERRGEKRGEVQYASCKKEKDDKRYETRRILRRWRDADAFAGSSAETLGETQQPLDPTTQRESEAAGKPFLHSLFSCLGTAWKGDQVGGFLQTPTHSCRLAETSPFLLRMFTGLQRSLHLVGSWIAPSVGFDIHPSSGSVSLAAELIPSRVAAAPRAASCSSLFLPPLLALSLFPDGVLFFSGGVDLSKCVLRLTRRLASLRSQDKSRRSARLPFASRFPSPLGLPVFSIKKQAQWLPEHVASRAVFSLTERRLWRLSRFLQLQVTGCIDTLNWRYTGGRACRCLVFVGDLPPSFFCDRREDILSASCASFSPPFSRHATPLLFDKEEQRACLDAFLGTHRVAPSSWLATRCGVCTSERFAAPRFDGGEYLFRIGHAFSLLAETGATQTVEDAIDQDQAREEREKREDASGEALGGARGAAVTASRGPCGLFLFSRKDEERQDRKDQKAVIADGKDGGRARRAARCGQILSLEVEGGVSWTAGNAALAFDLNKWCQARRMQEEKAVLQVAKLRTSEDTPQREREEREGADALRRRETSREEKFPHTAEDDKVANRLSPKEAPWGVVLDLGTLHIRVTKVLLRLESL